MTSLIRQLNQSRTDLARTLRDGNSRLDELRTESTRSQDLLDQEQRLEELRDTRVVNPRQTANNFARLLEGDGGFGAAIAFGVTSAQADFADLVDKRIQDASSQLQELRQRERDAVQDQQVSFNQQLAVNRAEAEAASAIVDQAASDRDRQDTLNQLGVTNSLNERIQDRADRGEDRANRAESRAQSAEQRAIRSEGRQDRLADASIRSTDANIAQAALNTQLKAIKIEDALIQRINDAKSGGITSEQSALEDVAITRLFEEIGSQGGASFPSRLFAPILFDQSGEEFDQGVADARKRQFIVENSTRLTQLVRGLKNKDNINRLADIIAGASGDDVIDGLQRQLTFEREDFFGDEDNAKNVSKQIDEYAILSAVIQDRKEDVDSTPDEVSRLERQLENIRSSLSSTLSKLQGGS